MRDNGQRAGIWSGSAVVVVVLLAGCGQAEPGEAPAPETDAGEVGADARGPHTSVTCVARVELDGHEYLGHGDPVRDPATTGRVEEGFTPACGDRPRRVTRVHELADLPMDRAVLVSGSLYIRSDLPFPDEARLWLEPPRCETSGSFEVTGDWLSVRAQQQARFDGDIRVPYRLGVHVTEGPSEYVGTRVTIRATKKTDPALGPQDVRRSLWRGGRVVAEVHCEDGRFVATGLTSTPR